MTYSVNIHSSFDDWDFVGVFLHRQEALKAAYRFIPRRDIDRIVVYEINGVGDDRVIYDSRKDHIALSEGKYHIWND
jgi:hypothetical protein